MLRLHNAGTIPVFGEARITRPGKKSKFLFTCVTIGATLWRTVREEGCRAAIFMLARPRAVTIRDLVIPPRTQPIRPGSRPARTSKIVADLM